MGYRGDVGSAPSSAIMGINGWPFTTVIDRESEPYCHSLIVVRSNVYPLTCGYRTYQI